MSERERAAYLALDRYFSCMRPLVKGAKAAPALTDSQVYNFGYRCPSQLRDAASKRELNFSSPPNAGNDDHSLSAPTRAARLALHEKELAGAFWCEFRTCYRM